MGRYFACFALTSLSLLAQEYRGTVRGAITDPSGAAVAGAMIRVTNLRTNTNAETTSNESGNYQVPFLLPSDYKVTVEHPGFKTVERESVAVVTGSDVILNFSLQLGAVSETINVTESTPLLNTASADLGLVINHNYMGNVGVSLSRNAINMVQLAPGVAGTTGTYTSTAQSTFSISGGGGAQGRNEILVDGIPNTVPLGGGRIVFVPSLDSVEEMKVSNTLFDASYGHSNGGSVSITTRAGTNDLHGAVYDFKRWAELNANNWASNHLGLDRPGVDYNMWGYTVGGPVWIPHVYNGRNRTFFSTSLERDSDARPMSLQGRVPTDLERSGDFSQTLNRQRGALTIFDPATTAVAAGRATRSAFAGNRIPASRLDATGVALLKAMPAPNLAGAPQIGQFNWAAAGIYEVDQTDLSARVDQYISSRQRLFGRFSRLTRAQVSDTFFTGLFNGPTADASNLGGVFRHFHNVAIDDTITFSPTFVGSFRYGFSRLLNVGTGGAQGADPAPLALPTTIVQNQAFRGFPIFNFTDAAASNIGTENMLTIGSSLSKEANDVHSLIASFTKLVGRHSLKFGADYRQVRWHRNTPGSSSFGNFAFSPVFTQSDPFTASTGNTSGTAMASALLGAPSAGSLGYTTPLSLQNQYLAGYIQEDWKIGTRLTVNFGLRYEMEIPLSESYNRASYGFDRGAPLPVKVPGLDLRGGLLFAGVNGNPRTEGSTDKNNFGPRFGFAFSLNPKTVLRGGYGMFYEAPSYNTTFVGTVGAFDAVTPFVGSVDSNATIFTTLRNPFPNGLRQPLGSSVGLLAQVGDTLSYADQSRLAPYNQQWQFSIQRQFPSQIVLDIAYMGMLSLKQFEAFPLNDIPDRYLPLGTAQNTAVPNPFLGVFPATSTLGQGATIPQRRLWVAFPQFNTLTLNGANTGRATYNSLQVKAEKRMSRGLSVLATYSYSKLLTNNTTSVINERHYHGVSQFDQRQLMRMAFTYQLPFHVNGQGMMRVARQAVQGWSLNGLLNLQSGVPLTITQANGRPIRLRNASLSAAVNQRLGDQRDSTGKITNPFFDTTAFLALPNQFTVAPDPPYLDELRAPGSRSLNASLFKTFSLRERLKLQFRLEAINVFNTPAFGPPGTNMSNPATFGVINTSSNERQMQAALRLEF